MFAVIAASPSPRDPVAGLSIGEHPDPMPKPGWETVSVRAAALNHHDIWTLRGVGIDPRSFPIVLGSDGSGVTSAGREVIFHSVVSTVDGSDDVLAADFSILSEKHDGTFADSVAVPVRNLVDKPPTLSFEEAACLPTAWLTAYRMLFTKADLKPGQRVLIQGAGGGVATAALLLARAAGLHVTVTSRDQAKLELALSIGAHDALPVGGRLSRRVDAVIETVGEATWAHSLRSVVPGGVIVISGATSGSNPPADLSRVFYRQIGIVGSTMGSRDELIRLTTMLDATGVRPIIDEVLPLEDARLAFERMLEGNLFGKLVLSR